MDSRTPKDDNYFASIKKFIIPFVLLNIVAVILGASAVNIANLLDFLAPEPQSEPAEITNQQITFDSDLSNKAENQAQVNDVAEQIIYSTIYLPSIGSSAIPQPVELSSLAYPEPEINPIVPKPEDNSTYDKVVSAPKESQENGNAAKVDSENAHEKELEAQVIEKQTQSELRQLILPTVDVTASIIDVPIVNGNWDISRLDDDAGVLDGFATHPEDSGAMVVAAHATTEWPTAGPFAELRLMNLGDPIIFQIGDTEYVYEISRFLRVDTSDVNVLNKGGEDGIVLVTCGSYNFFTGEYGSRLIAYGNLKETRPAEQNSDL